MRSIKKILSILVIISICANILSLIASAATDEFDDCRELNEVFSKNLYCYFEKAKEKIKMGEKHVTVQNEKNIPNYRLELFRYTALDEIILSLKFEKEPDKFIKNKYRDTFNLIKNISTGVGIIVGVIFGLWLPKGISCLNSRLNKKSAKIIKQASSFQNTKTDRNNLSKNKNDKWLKFSLSIILSGLIAFLGRTLAEYGIANFESKELKKMLIKKRNSLMAIESAMNHIDDKDWVDGNVFYIRECLDVDTYNTVTGFLYVDEESNSLTYSKDEKKYFNRDFEALSRNLSEVLKNNKN